MNQTEKFACSSGECRESQKTPQLAAGFLTLFKSSLFSFLYGETDQVCGIFLSDQTHPKPFVFKDRTVFVYIRHFVLPHHNDLLDPDIDVYFAVIGIGVLVFFEVKYISAV